MIRATPGASAGGAISFSITLAAERKKLRALPVLALLALAMLAPVPALAADDDLEYRVKTGFLFNFARFVTWPPGKFATPNSPIDLCILASDAFGRVLADITKNKLVNGRPIRVTRVFYAADAQRCHIAYFEDAAAAAANLAAVAGHQVLTVYEQESAQAGGVIRFYIDGQRVRFEINQTAAERETLQIRSKLLDLARVVYQ